MNVVIPLCLALSILAQPAKGSTTVRGDVVDAHDGLIPGVTVCILDPAVCTTTDLEGEFQFVIDEGITPGQTITLTASFEGFMKAEREVTICSAIPAVHFALSANIVSDCTIWNDEVTYGVLGTVLSDKKPIPHSAITVTSSKGIVWRTKSDRHGKFEIMGFSSDTYRLDVSSKGYQPQRINFDVQYCLPVTELKINLSEECR